MDAFLLQARLTLDTSQYDEALRQVRTDLPQTGRDLDSAGEKASKFGTALAGAAKVAGAAIAAATTAVGAFAKSAVSVGAGFDSAMSQVAATMGMTMSEMQEQVGETDTAFGHFKGNLREFAEYMGANTAFSATQAAEALNYMALAGYDAQTSMKMLPNVLNLAAAGGMELASASDMVTDAQSALGLSFDQTTELVDKMAMASSKSNTSVAQLGEAMLTIGATAKQLSGGTTELATALGILADNGVKGAEGGTALRNVLNSLSSDKFKKSFGALGVSAYDADGNMRSLKDTLADMNAVMADMTTQEKTELIKKAFNAYDLAKVNALLDTSAERWDTLSSSIDNAAQSAQNMADTQLDNLAGNITLFQSALEGVQITISEYLNPSLSEFVKYGAEALGTLNQAFKADGLEGAMNELPALLDKGLAMVFDKIPQFIDVGAQVLGAVASGIINNLPTLIDGATSIIYTIIEDIYIALPEVANAAVDIVTTLADSIGENWSRILPTVISGIDELANALTNPDNLSSILNAGLDLVVTFADGIADNLPKLVDTATDIVTNLVEFVIDPANLAKIVTSAVKIVGALATGLINAIPKLVEGAGKLVVGIVDVFINTDWLEVGKNLVIGIAEGIVQASQKVWDAGFDLGKKIYEAVHSGAENVEQSNPLKDDIIQLSQGFFSYYDEILGENENALRDFAAKYSDVVQDVGDGFKFTFDGTEDVEYVITVLDDLEKAVEDTGEATGELSSMYAGIKVASVDLKAAADNVNEYIDAQNRLAAYSQAKFIPTEALRQQQGKEAAPLVTEEWAASSGWADRGGAIVTAIENTGSAAAGAVTAAAEAGKKVSKSTSKATKEVLTFATKEIGEYKNLGIVEKLGQALSEEDEKAKSIAKTVWDASKEYATRKIKDEQLSFTDQIDMWKMIRDQFVENSEQWNEANSNMLEAQRKAQDEAAKLGKEGIERQIKEQELGNAEQAALWLAYLANFEEGTEEWNDINNKYLDARNKARADEKKAEEQRTADEQKELDKRKKAYEQYQQALEKIDDEIVKVQQNYTDQLEKETQTIYNSFGLFDEVPELVKIDGDELIKNLEEQNNRIKDFYNDVAKLEARGVSAAMAAEIRAKGVSAASELKAILSMTDEELAKYQSEYDKKNKYSSEFATSWLEPIKKEVDERIEGLYGDKEAVVKEYADQYGQAFVDGNLEAIDAKTGEFSEGIAESVTGAVDTALETVKPEIKEKMDSLWQETLGTDSTASLGTIQPELTANMTVNNENHFEFKINGIQFQNMNQLAKAISNELQNLLNRRKAGYAGT